MRVRYRPGLNCSAELIPLYDAEPAAKRKPKALQQKDKAAEHGQTTLLGQFVTKGAASGGDMDDPPEAFDQDVLMNEDGTMTLDSL
jgi:DNA polymerase epsilon subunit 4